jgi:hypothetical protein
LTVELKADQLVVSKAGMKAFEMVALKDDIGVASRVDQSEF